VRTVHLDGSRIRSPSEFFDAVAAALDFPSYFGRNWDALDECLDDIGEQTVVEWAKASRFATADLEGYETALRCFAESDAPVELRLIEAKSAIDLVAPQDHENDDSGDPEGDSLPRTREVH
jgi:RNAse (barnase) inhibitor barstar